MQSDDNNSDLRAAGWWLLGSALLGVVGLVDYLTGYDACCFPLYFVPVWLLARQTNLASGIFMAILVTGTWFLVDQASGHTYVSPIVGYWNVAMILATSLLSALVTATVRRNLLRQQALEKKVEDMRAEIEQIRKSAPQQISTSFLDPHRVLQHPIDVPPRS